MRKRNHLQVNTFPFLAVLLCAMGALILVLLVMDRRSKLVAQARANEQARRQAEEYAAIVASRNREYEKKQRAALAAHEKKRKELAEKVNAEESALSDELQKVRTRMEAAARRLREEEEKVARLRDKLKAEEQVLAKQQEKLEATRSEASGLGRKLTEADRSKAKLAGELAELEKTLSELKAARERDAETYSVIPYKGKRGDSRRPLYVECAASGLIFHPDGKALPPEEQKAVREEVERRIAVQKTELARENVSQETPYLMLLIRPDGIKRYYQIQNALHDVRVDFGYEFVDAGWKLHVPGEKDGPPPTQVAKAEGPAPARPTSTGPLLGQLPSPTALPGGEKGTGGRGGEAVPGSGTATAGIPSSPALIPEGTGTAGGDGGPAARTPLSGADVTPGPPAPPAGAEKGRAAGLGQPEPVSPTPAAAGTARVPGTPPSGPMAGPPVATAKPGPQGSVALARPQPHPPRPGPVEANGSGKPAASQILAPIPAKGAADNGSPAGGSPPVAGASPGRNGQDNAGPGLAFTPPPGEARKRPEEQPALRPARVSGAGEILIFVECQEDLVVVHPSRKRVSIEALSHSPGHNPLLQAIRRQVARRMAAARPGDPPPRLHIRFLVHNKEGKGLRTFHMAYPVVEDLKGEKTRYDLDPLDDVARIVAGQ